MRSHTKIVVLTALMAIGSVADAADQVRDPAKLYQKFCSVCHGDHGDADTRAAGSLSPRPRNFTAPEALAELSRERMIKSVTEGRPGTAMMSHTKKLNPKEIEGVVDYIRGRFMGIGPGGQVQAVAENGQTMHGAVGGEGVYRKHCAPCHGDDGSASSWAKNSLIPPPRNFTADAARAELTKARMIKSVTEGRPGTAMQPFAGRLSPADIESVVQYVRTTFMKVDGVSQGESQSAGVPGTHPHRGPGALPTMNPSSAETVTTAQAPVDIKAPFPNKLKGNPKAGESFYMHNCIVCHGPNGDGNGPRAYFITPRPRNFTSEQSRESYGRLQLFDAVTHGKRGTVMPAWGKVLTDQQVADVAEFVFQAYIRGSYKITLQPGDEAKKKVN